MMGRILLRSLVLSAGLLTATSLIAAEPDGVKGPIGSGRFETVLIPMNESGLFGRQRALTLEATLYQPAADGPRPILIFNHGSTGPGSIPATLTLRAATQ